ncbi:ABC transporter permease [Thermosporothrix hazakensis]|uniref:ABC transporter permease n=1 Tax=Thermosporothrix sp. COM3 TaxID=2490863 RepID=A0A455SCC2_9CHLR|nr:ABC transporter permease [Thermosporothrix sp. COM3]GCE45478.1 ABC transporter permease [Thermosporothrix hazakensis]
MAAVVGYFLIVRGLTFAGHSLAHIGFAGAAGAVFLGIHPVIGLLIFTIGSGVGIGFLARTLRERDIAIGVVTTFTLALGFLFLSLYRGYAEKAYSILFGTIVGISSLDSTVTLIFSILALAVLCFLFRPLLFSSVDPEVAQARGMPVRLLSVLFLVIVAITISISVQIVGVLLIFTLLVGPAATAIRIARTPLGAIALSIVLGIIYIWVGIYLAAITPLNFYPLNTVSLPISFCVATISFGVYLPVRLLSPLWLNRRRRELTAQPQPLAMQPEQAKMEPEVLRSSR